MIERLHKLNHRHIGGIFVAINYNEQHNMFRQSLRKFYEKEVAPYYEDWEKEMNVPRSIWKKFGSQGFLCPWIPEKYGGSGLGFEYSVIAIEEMARANVGIPFGLHSDVVVPYLHLIGNEEQKEKWLPGCASGDILTAIAMTEPSTGSDLAAVQTTAIKDGDDYIINGQKVFITNGLNSDIVIVVCKTGDHEKRHRNISLIVVEAGTPGFEKSAPLKKMGRHLDGTVELFFENCRVPQSNLLGEEGKGFYYLMQNLQQERIVAALGSLLAAEKMFNEGLSYSKERMAFGRRIGSFQANSFKLAEMATEIEIARTFIESLIRDHVDGKQISVSRVSMAKWWTSEMANRVAYHSLQLFGGYGYMDEYPISKHYRNVRVDTIFAGSTEIMKTIIAKELGL